MVVGEPHVIGLCAKAETGSMTNDRRIPTLAKE
jgi:hypothetical protein